jgi:two-component system, cell cycle sensor histidine kinase and response regulator CckA
MKSSNRIYNLFQRFYTFSVNQMVPATMMEKDSLIYWRVNILFVILFTGVLSGILAVVAGVFLSIKAKTYVLAFIDVIAYGLAIWVLITKKLRYEIRATITLLGFYGIGLAVISNLGVLSGGPAWLFTFAVLAGVLLGPGAALLATALNGATLGIIGWLVTIGYMGQALPFFNSPQAMIAAGINFLILNLIAAMSIAVLVKGLVAGHKKEKILTHQLERERTRLVEAKQELELEVEERRQTEVALRESEQQYRGILENIEDVYFRSDMTGNVLLLSPSGLHLFGFSDMDEVERVNIAQDIYHPPEALEDFIQQLKVHGTVKSYELMLKRKDGTLLNGETSARLVYDSSGKVVAIEGILRDITDRKEAEKEKRRLETRLQRAQKMEALGTLAGGVAHDLNNVLSGIVSYPDLLLMDLPENSPLRKPIVTMQTSGKKAAAIVEDLLTLARRGVATTETVNLNALIEDYLQSAEHQKLLAFHPQTQIDIDLQATLLNIVGSPIHLSKTIMNLVSNAVEAMPDGGRIKIATANRYIDRPVTGYDHVIEDDYVTLTVSDTGVGISQTDRERIFEPFYTKKVMGRSGTGLGMAVVWGTIKDHKGYIDLQSKEGQGSTFTLYIPATRQGLDESPQVFALADYKGQGESILVVDDIAEQREIAAALLNQLGYEVVTVASGEDAIACVQEQTFDLLILDMIMAPGIDGLETYRRIREQYPNQKAIIASGFSETERVKTAQGLGAGSYLKKPYTLEKLGLTVKTELGR